MSVRVALFAACFNNVMWPETPKAVVRLLRSLGCEVEFPLDQTCYGQMFTNTGYAEEAIPAVRNFAATFAGYDAVVAPSGSCLGSVRHQVLPSRRDLEVFLQVLPRTTAAPECSPTPSAADALRCIRCSACLNICPVYERTGKHSYGSVYPGPIGAVLTPQLRGITSDIDKSLPFASRSVRRVLRRLPGAHRHPVDAGTPAHPGGRREPRRRALRRAGHSPITAGWERLARWHP